MTAAPTDKDVQTSILTLHRSASFIPRVCHSFHSVVGDAATFSRSQYILCIANNTCLVLGILKMMGCIKNVCPISYTNTR